MHIFERVTVGAIAANTALLLWSLVDANHAEFVDAMDKGLLWFFAVEVAVRLRRAGRGCWRDGWLLFDVAVVAAALMPVGVNLTAMRVARAARLTHFGRHVSHLRLVSVARRLLAHTYGHPAEDALRRRRGEGSQPGFAEPA